MEFKEKILITRKQLLLSQADFAQKLGVGIATINRWEKGVCNPNYIMQRKFVEYCEKNDIRFDKE